MKLPILAAATAIVMTRAPVHGRDTDETPIMILPNGGLVYSKPISGGKLTLKSDAMVPAAGVDSTLNPTDEMMGLLVQPRGDAMDNTVIHLNESPPGPTPNIDDPDDYAPRYEVDLSSLRDLTKESFEMDFGTDFNTLFNLGVGPISFLRDDAYDETTHPHLHHKGLDETTRSMLYGGNKKQRHRRATDLAQDSLCSIVDHSDIGECEFSIEYGVDYLPANAYFDPDDPTQKFEYFEGSGLYEEPSPEDPTSTITRVATVYIKKMVHPRYRNTSYISGSISTSHADFEFGGDMDTGRTYVKVTDPTKVPEMNQPLVPPPGSEDEDEEDDDEEYYPSLEGRRLKNDDNPFADKVQGQKFIPHLEKEHRAQQRRMQTDDGSVIDCLVVYTGNAMCQQNGHGKGDSTTQCAGKGEDYFADPINHVKIMSTAQDAVEYTNKAYTDSGINTRIRLVYNHHDVAYNDYGVGCGEGLNHYTKNNPSVKQLRNAWGADIVVILTSSAVSGCGGIAWVGPTDSHAYSLTLAPYARQAVFAHEVGHNMGCWHDRNNAPTSSPYSYGWQDPEAKFRTIMAYRCPNGYCPRIQYFSNPNKKSGGKIMGNAINDCARQHNDARQRMANNRKVFITTSPTESEAPSYSLVPSQSPTKVPTMAPTISGSPSLVPSTSLEPSNIPSEFPSFSNVDLDNFLKIDSPGSFTYQAEHGVMFDVTAKDTDMTIHNFRIPFLKQGNMSVSVWSREGSFWYEKNNPDEWDFMGSPSVYSQGITLEDPRPLTQRAGYYYGFAPIVIPARTKKGIFIVINETSLDDNLIGMDRKQGSSCAADYQDPFNFSIWFENPDLTVSEGVYKNKPDIWSESFGTSNNSFRFLGSIYYSTGPPVPSLQPSISSSPSAKSVWAEMQPSFSSQPSSQPSTQPSLQPSTTSMPSTSVNPTPTNISELKNTGIHVDLEGLDGIMFDVQAIKQNILIRNFKLVIFSQKSVKKPADLFIYIYPGSLYDQSLGDSVARAGWTQIGTFKVTATPTLIPLALPYFEPIHVKKGTTMGIYITINDPLHQYKILTRKGATLMGTDPDFPTNDYISVSEGISKQWDNCASWGITLRDTKTLSPRPFAFYGSILYSQGGTSSPTTLPSLQPSLLPSISANPSLSVAPSGNPSSIPSALPTTSYMPSQSPSTSQSPSNPYPYQLVSLPTGRGENLEGSSGDGVMFDVIAVGTLQVHSVTFGQMATYPMNIKVYSRGGSHYHAYDDESQWDLIKSYTNYTHNFDDDENTRKIAFPPQNIRAGQTRAFYIAIVETYGEVRPLLTGLIDGQNYSTGVWASDDQLSLMEGVKLYGISQDHPFGKGTSTSGVFKHEGPGGKSYNMKGATLRYLPVVTITPSISPSISQVPTESQVPSGAPTTSDHPSLVPSTSLEPSLAPSDKPSISVHPSESPSTNPSNQPSLSVQPSQNPTESAMPSVEPSSEPSSQPSSQPSIFPSISFQPSSQPSSVPSESPSVSNMPSTLPTVSLMPSASRLTFTSSSDGASSGAYGVMFEIIPKRAIVVETFHVDWFGWFGVLKTFNFHVYTKHGSWTNSITSENAWTKIGHVSIEQTKENPAKLPSTMINPVTIFAGQKQSFYIASVGLHFKVKEETSPSSNSNDLSLFNGRKQYPTDKRFSSSGSNGYRFQGQIIYSLTVDPPSSAPSMSPSSIPSENPSAVPSSDPSELPSKSPSISSAPSPSTDSPSDVPSSSSIPSASPTPLPTASPTHSPSQLPSLSLAPTVSKPRVQITIPSSITIQGFGIPETTAEIATIISILVPSIASLVQADLINGQRLKEVIILSINGKAVNSSTLGRQLGSETVSRRLNGLIDIQYKITLEQLCESITCNNSQQVANAFYESVTTKMQAEIQSGEFVETMRKTALEQSIEVELSVTKPNFSALVVTVLALLSITPPPTRTPTAKPTTRHPTPLPTTLGQIIWYPGWSAGIYCLDDDKQPYYMKQNYGLWMYSSQEACCKQYYSFAYSACMGADSTAIGYYPAWDGSSTCLNDNNVPDYMRNKPSLWVYGDLQSCCRRYYGWKYQDCMYNSQLGTGSISQPSSTYKWYVDHQHEICKQGPANTWDILHKTATDCCMKQLPWIATATCLDHSV